MSVCSQGVDFHGLDIDRKRSESLDGIEEQPRVVSMSDPGHSSGVDPKSRAKPDPADRHQSRLVVDGGFDVGVVDVVAFHRNHSDLDSALFEL